MTGPLAARLSSGRPVLLDGAMGTELDARGVATYLPLWSALGLIERPDVVEQIHVDYAEAGADILITNTFRTTSRTLATAARDPGEAASLDRLAVELAKRASARSPRRPLVAGSLAPLEDCYSPWLSLGSEIAYREHREQAQRLAVAGSDFLMIETMPLIAEAVAALKAAGETGLEVTVGFVLGMDGVLLSGETLADAVRAVEPHLPAAIFVNCTPPDVIDRALPVLRDLTELPIGVYANLGVAQDSTGWTSDSA